MSIRIAASAGRTSDPDGFTERTASGARVGVLALMGWLACAVSAHANTPIGWLETVNAGGNRLVRGWALDTAAPSTSIDVHVYFEIGIGTIQAWATTTNIYRPDVNAAYGVTGNHGFEFTIPEQFLDGGQHKVDAFGIDPHGGTNPFLSGSGVLFTYQVQPPSLTSPVTNSYESTPVFYWQRTLGATYYDLWVYYADDHDWVIHQGPYTTAQVCSGDVCGIAPGTSLHAGSYKWRVKALNISTWAWSGYQPFDVWLPPASPGLIWPKNDCSELQPTFQWYAAPGATSYRVTILNAQGGELTHGDFYSSSCSGSICTANLGYNHTAGDYSWKVRSLSPVDFGYETGTQPYRIVGPPPPVLIGPSGTASPLPTFSWNAASGATAYVLTVDKVGGSNVIAPPAYNASSICSGSTCSVAPGTLLSIGATYTWTVKSRNAIGDSVWTTPAPSFTVSGTPTLVSPLNGATLGNPYVTYVWNTVSGATQYFLEVTPAGGGSAVDTQPVAASACSGATCTFNSPTTLSIGGYNWHVQAMSGPDGSAWSSTRTFSVQGAATPVPQSPNTTSKNPYPTFVWNPVAGAIQYHLFVDFAPQVPENPAYQNFYGPEVCTASTCSVSPGAFGLNSYSWKVQAKNAAGWGDFSSPVGFTIEGPGVPTPLTPNGQISTASPAYVWTPAGGAASYDLWVKDGNGGDYIQDPFPATVCSGGQCSATSTKPLIQGSYTWRVRGRNAAGGTGSWSDPRPINLLSPTWNGSVCGGTYTMADFDGDGRTDQLCAQSGVVYVVLSKATGPQQGVSWIVGDLPAHTTFADVDGDGKTDIVIESSGNFYVSKSTGSSFTPFTAWGASSALWNGSTFNCQGAAARIGMGDFDGDGRPDAYCQIASDGRFLVGRNTGSAFQPSVFGNNACDFDRVGTVDFDGDGRTDWYCAGRYALTVMLSNGTSFEANSFTGLDGSFCAVDQVQLGDYNGDGRPDAFCAGNGKVALNTGRSFLLQGSFDAFCPNGTNALVADINGDRVPEIVCNRDGAGQLDIQIRRWTGATLLPEQRIAGNWCSGSVTAADLDGDGRPDLVCNGWWETERDAEGHPTGNLIQHPVKYAVVGTSGVVPDLMTEAENGLGGKTRATYDSTANLPGATTPPAKTVLTSITTDDGRGGVATTRYQYSGGKSDPTEGFLGYAYVKATKPCLASESLCPYSEVWLSQEVPSLGKPTATRESDGSGLALRSATYTYTNTLSPVRNSLPARVDTADYSADNTRTRTTAVTYDLYDGAGNVTQQTELGETGVAGDELQTTMTYTYDVPAYTAKLATRVQKDGSAVTVKSLGYTYSGPNLYQVTTHVLPQVTDLGRTMEYDSYGNPTKITDEIGGVTTITYTTDGLHPQVVTRVAASSTEPNEATTTDWDPVCGVPTTVTDPNGQVTTTTYDALCRPLRTDAPLGSFQDRSYEQLGDPTAQCTRVEGPGTNGNDFREDCFDGLGRVYKSRKRGPSAGETIVVARSYDARGNIATTSEPFYAADPSAEPDPSDLTTYTYDAFDRITVVDPPDHNRTTKSYDLWSETTTDANQKARTSEWTSLIRKQDKQTINGEQVTTRYDYDVLGRPAKVVDAKSNQWTWQYDSLDRVYPSQTDPDAGTRSFTYDETTRTNTQTDAKGQTITVKYDKSGRTTSKSSTAGNTTYTYSTTRSGYLNKGRLTTISTPAVGSSPALTMKIDYDARGRVAKQARTIGSTTYTVTKTYDPGDRLTNMAFSPGNDGFGLGYDEAGRFYSATSKLNTTTSPLVTSVTYDAAGRPLVQTNANGSVTTRTYWPDRGLLHTLATTSAGQTIQSFSYDDYDPVGLLRQVTSSAAGGSWTYDYDDGYRLTSAANTTSTPDSQTFTYDALGRMTYNSRVGAYQYPADGNPRPHAPSAIAGSTYQYDPNGNLISGGGRSPQWDAEDRISAIGSTTFAYDDDGERVKKAAGSTTTYYPFGDDWEFAGSVTTKYLNVEGLGVLAKRVIGGSAPGLYWIHTDRLGSIGLETNLSGAVTFQRTYRPYGESLGSTGAAESRGWIDQRNDPETGLTYLHARYFDPKLGLFLSPDPSNPDLRGVGTNRYAYGFGNPINGTDRSGLEWGACDDGSGDTCWHDDQTHYSDSMTIGGGGINAWNWTYISQLIARIKAQAAALAAYYAAQNARQNPGGGGGGGGGGPEKPTDPAAPASKSRLIEAFQAGTCAAARAFFAKVPFPDIFPGRGDFGVSLTVSGAVSRFFAAGEEGMTRIWAPGGNYATFTYSAAGATVGANDVSPLTGNIAIEVGVTRQVDWSSVTQGGAQFGGAAAAGLGGAFSLSRSDGGGAWGLSMGPAGGLTAGLTGARTETVLRDQGNVLKDMGCE